MTENFKILAEFVKDISSETPDVQSYIFVKENISKYNLKIDIISKALKDKMIEVNTTMKFEDKELSEKRSYFEIVYASIIKVDESIKDKQDLEKIVLCDVQNKIYPNLKKTFLDLLHNSGFPEVKLDKEIDFTQLYKQRSN
ncbi:protein-export chaperone SecB [Candidatus Pelagibacter sp.]|jgi:preprotein translocase subunit SecB|nr:protein-export chaperone SecB [Candidatus Pelagibacter sp.]|tara:strand:- start:536 stop:958 length:423 start_codon:yes stop_codon:yes gene_type:complete